MKKRTVTDARWRVVERWVPQSATHVYVVQRLDRFMWRDRWTDVSSHSVKYDAIQRHDSQLANESAPDKVIHGAEVPE